MAQIMAVHMGVKAKSRPLLLAILGSPSAGNADFADILRERILPKPGGVRVWNEGDRIPWLGLKAYGYMSFAGLEVMLEGQGDPIANHLQYTTVMPGSKCATYLWPLVYQPRGLLTDSSGTTNLRAGGYAEVHTSEALRAWQSSRSIETGATNLSDDRTREGGLLAKEAGLNTALLAKGIGGVGILEAAVLSLKDTVSAWGRWRCDYLGVQW